MVVFHRSEERGRRVVEELMKLNSGGEAILLRKDISLLSNVDQVCQELKTRESNINCLFITAGHLTLQGRDETAEGIDCKMSVNYYARMRFILNLMPLLKTASVSGELSRVITILAAGSEGDVQLDDLDLQHHFSLHSCLAHCVLMSDFAVEQLSQRYPGTSFSHSYPGTLKTGIASQLSGPMRLAIKVMYSVMTPWIIDLQESGERHLFQMTSRCYPAASGGAGVPAPPNVPPVAGMDGVPGSGGYLLDWDGTPTGDKNVLDSYRKIDMGNKVWEHTMHIFAQADARHQSSGAAGPSGADTPHVSDPSYASDPPGWRAA